MSACCFVFIILTVVVALLYTIPRQAAFTPLTSSILSLFPLGLRSGFVVSSDPTSGILTHSIQDIDDSQCNTLIYSHCSFIFINNFFNLIIPYMDLIFLRWLSTFTSNGHLLRRALPCLIRICWDELFWLVWSLWCDRLWTGFDIVQRSVDRYTDAHADGLILI